MIIPSVMNSCQESSYGEFRLFYLHCFVSVLFASAFLPRTIFILDDTSFFVNPFVGMDTSSTEVTVRLFGGC